MRLQLRRELRHARPSLHKVSPLSWWIVMVMAIFNVVLGLSFLLLVDEDRFAAPLFIVNDVLTFKLWGWLFIVLGLVKGFSIFINNWGLARASLFMGVSVKAAWMVALTIRTIISPGTFFLNILWIALALIQMGAYVYFLPPALTTKPNKE